MSKSVALLLVLVFLIASCIVVVKPIWAPSASENSWETMASMPTARSRMGIGVVNGKIYAIGGASEGEDNVNEMYDPATDTWTTKQSMPTPRYSLAVAAYENKIYCIGGAHAGANEVYDPATDTWTTKQSMLTPRSFMQANVVEGKIYLIGGSSGAPTFQHFSVNEVYDPASDTWTTKKPMPTAVWGYASVVIDNMIYIIGGSDNGSLLQIYDPRTDTWSYGTSLPTRVAGAAAAATSGVWAPRKIYVLGATDGLFSYNSCLVYDPETDSWSSGASMPTARAYLGVAVVDDFLYAIGGTGSNYMEPPVSVNEKYTPFGYGLMPPVVQVVSPEQNKRYSSGNVSLAFTVDRHFTELCYSMNGEANVTITGNTTLTGLTSGVHNVTVYAAGPTGNAGASQPIHFTVDFPPNVSLLSPRNQNYTSTDVSLIFTVNEPVSEISYVLDGLENVAIDGNTTLTVLANGDHNVTVYAADVTGNVGVSETVSFVVAVPVVLEPFLTALVVAASGASLAVVAAGLLVYFKKRKH